MNMPKSYLAWLDDPEGILRIVLAFLKVGLHLLNDGVLDQGDEPRKTETIGQLDQAHASRGGHAPGHLVRVLQQHNQHVNLQCVPRTLTNSTWLNLLVTL